MYKMTFAQRFKFLRSQKEMSQDELAADFELKTGTKMTKSGISGYENGKRIPEVLLLQTMAEYFDVSIDYLLGRTDEKKTTIQSESGLREDNVKYKRYSDMYDEFRRMLIENGLLGEDEELTPEQLKKFLCLGMDTAQMILRSKNIDTSVLGK